MGKKSFILLCILLIPIAQAHAPLSPDTNEALDTATHIPDPTKSWAIYGELHEGGEAQYYRFDIEEGQRIHITLFTPTGEEGFTPWFVLMGPDLPAQDVPPDFVEVPPDARAWVVEGEIPEQATYEPFSPSTFYQLADFTLDAPASSTYYIAVFELAQGGHYGLAIGDREEFSPLEWIRIPLSQISIYQWEGQSTAFIFAPMVLIVVFGLFLMLKRGDPRAGGLFYWVGAIAGFLFIGTGATALTQIAYNLTQGPQVPEMGVTTIFAIIPILIGIGTLRIAGGRVDVRRRIFMFVVGIIALFAWAGLLVGPVLAVIASMLPSRTGYKAEPS